ncbi:hypothetical protein HQ590_10790 [bacterium]|nr:hypothetical protein [bacterium]
MIAIDFDDCFDAAGKLTEPAATWVPKLASYTERTPSGQGLHTWVRATLPFRGGANDRKAGIEIYERARYFTLTGKPNGTWRTVEQRQEMVDAFVAEFFPGKLGKQPVPRSTDEPTPAFTDEDVLDKARSARNGDKFMRLWAGDAKGYASPSEADLALVSLLAFWTQNTAQLERLWLRSGLKRDKTERADYVQRTIDRALQRDEVYKPTSGRDPDSTPTSEAGRDINSPQVGGPDLPSLAYDETNGVYWQQVDTDRWARRTLEQIRRLLRLYGFSGTGQPRGTASAVDRMVCKVENECSVQYAAPLAGWRAGINRNHGRRILVTDSSRLILSAPGQWPVLHQVLEGLLDQDQLRYLLSWLKIAKEALAKGEIRPGQCLGLAGPVNSGKTFVAKHVITPLLGDRIAKPYSWMTGRTDFNAELFQAEHLLIDDEAASLDIRSRRQFGANLKQLTVASDQRCHRKHATPTTLDPFWRVVICVNDDPEHLAVLPPLDGSIEDKLMLLRCRYEPMPMPTVTDEQRRQFRMAVESELPAFAHFLEQYKVPEELVEGRFGLLTYHDQSLLEALNSLAPEYKLLDLIDGWMAFGEWAGGGIWEGSAADLGRQLRQYNRPEADRLLTFSSAESTYLGRLAKSKPQRVQHARLGSGDLRGWRIVMPDYPAAGSQPKDTEELEEPAQLFG